MGKQVEILKYHPKTAADGQDFLVALINRFSGRVRLCDILPFKADAPLVGNLKMVQAPEQRALSRTGRPDDGNDLPFFHFQVDPLQHVERMKALMQVFNFNDLVHSVPPNYNTQSAFRYI